jgi:hypothetical protein
MRYEKWHLKKTELREEKLEDIQARLQLSLRKSLKQLSLEKCVFLGSACKTTKLIHFHPYKVTVVHQLEPTDPPSGFVICCCMFMTDLLIDICSS